MRDFYNFNKPNAKAYECDCPSGFIGDKCELCPSGNGTYRYQIGEIVCEHCGCSDLSSSDECDRSTGQCSCGDDIDITLAGRQCVSVSVRTNHSQIYIACIYIIITTSFSCICHKITEFFIQLLVPCNMFIL